MSHTRQSDTELLMLSVVANGLDFDELLAAVERLKNCHDEGLQDYSIPK